MRRTIVENGGTLWIANVEIGAFLDQIVHTADVSTHTCDDKVKHQDRNNEPVVDGIVKWRAAVSILYVRIDSVISHFRKKKWYLTIDLGAPFEQQEEAWQMAAIRRLVQRCRSILCLSSHHRFSKFPFSTILELKFVYLGVNFGAFLEKSCKNQLYKIEAEISKQ